MPKIVLALVPHPDDAEFYAGGLLATLIADGARVHIVVATDGRRGSFEIDSATLAELRGQEMRRAAAALGAEPPILLGYPDHELDTLPPGTLREQFVRAIRRFKPDVVVAEDPYAPFEPHPDHRAVAWAATEALNHAHLPLLYPEHLADGLGIHFVAEKYFYANSPALANQVVDITDAMPVKLAALVQHASQVRFLVEGMLRQARLAGLDIRALFGEAADDPAALLAWGVQTQAAAVGRSIGAQYGEAFRYERFDPLIEGALQQAAGSRDRRGVDK